jgi:pimeloyl-ACP methyl ester carboxylesterase
MKKVQSADGTTIAFDQLGKGPALILVGGALEQRAMDSETAQLAPRLSQHFTVFHYDRRGRGESTDTQPYAVEREIEDIEALITEAGGSAFVFGISSGAALAMEAAIKLGDKVKKLAMYEAPYNSDEAARLAWKAYRKQLAEVLAQGRRGNALALFMLLVGMPADHLDRVRQHPMWPMWEAVAPTLAYDAAVMGEDASVPTEKAVGVAVPALIMDGSASFPFMHITATALANAIPNAEHRTLEGQTHEVAVEALAPVLVEFFNSNAA